MLEIQPTTLLSADLIRRQWNMICQRYATKVFTKMEPRLVEMAKATRAAIRQAAERLLAPMGEKLEQDTPSSAAQELRHNPDLDDVFGL